jgi:exosortase
MAWSSLRWGIGLALLGALLWPVLAHAATIWAGHEELSFGFAVPPVAALLIARRWSRLLEVCRQDGGRGSPAGLLVVVAALAALLLAQRLWAKSPAAYAAGLLLWGAAVYLWGWRAGRILAFPLGLLAFGLGLQPTLISPVAFALQGLTARGAALVAQGIGLPVIHQGLVLQTLSPAGWSSFVVADVCSGMSSLLALTTLAALWLHLAAETLRARVVVLLSVVPLVLGANSVRVTLVLVIATLAGDEAALGFLHGASSLVIFGLTLSGLLLVARLAGCRLPALLAREGGSTAW